jgi:MFS family permease
MGPIIGSVLYEAGGFMLPFFFCGTLLFLLTIPICCVLQEKKGYVAAEQQSNRTPLTNNSHRRPINTNFFAVLCKFPVLASAFCMSCSLMCLTFKEPMLQLRLLESGLSTWMIGIIFSLDTLTYTLTSVVLNFIPESQKNYQKMVASGTMFFVVAMLLSGPCPGLPDEVWLICIGILVGGIGGALINNNVVPSLNNLVKSDKVIKDAETRDKLTNAISAINTGFFGLGSILGPILASVLSDLLTFRLSFTIVSSLVLLTMIIQWVAVCMTKAKY